MPGSSPGMTSLWDDSSRAENPRFESRPCRAELAARSPLVAEFASTAAEVCAPSPEAPSPCKAPERGRSGSSRALSRPRTSREPLKSQMLAAGSTRPPPNPPPFRGRELQPRPWRPSHAIDLPHKGGGKTCAWANRPNYCVKALYLASEAFNSAIAASGSTPVFLTLSAQLLNSGSAAFFHKAVCSAVSV